jgi:hypothetical protein
MAVQPSIRTDSPQSSANARTSTHVGVPLPTSENSFSETVWKVPTDTKPGLHRPT